MEISKRSKFMPSSPIRKLFPYANQAKNRGIKVYHLNIGQPDIETPTVFFDAIRKYSEPVLAYGPSDGYMFLKEAMVDYFKRYEIELSSDEICITNGGSEAISFALNIVCDKGDEVIVFEPFYANYAGYAASSGVKLVPLSLKAEDEFHIKDFDKIVQLISPSTKAILIGSPNNPTGTVLSREEIFKIYDIAKKYDLFILSDEVYKEFIYTGEKHFSVLELPEPERVIVIDSISKRFSACGARVGSIITKNRVVMENILKLAMARLCPPTLEQIGAAAAYRLPANYFDPVREEYKKRRDICYNILSSTENVVINKPEGAFYMVAKLPVKNAEIFAKWLLTDFNIDNETTMVAPASGFYQTPHLGHDEIRIAYVLKEENLKKSLNILKKGLEKYVNIEDSILEKMV